METIGEVLQKKDTFDILWNLLKPGAEFQDRKNACRGYWNALELQRQRQIYYTLFWQKKRGETINPNPLFAIQDCHPVPTNWNGRPGLNDLMKTTKMVSAKYGQKYGIYTAKEAELFELKDIKPLNFNQQDGT